MARGPKTLRWFSRGGAVMPAIWQAIQSFFVRNRLWAGGSTGVSSNNAVVALVVGDRDRQVLADVSARETLDLHFVESSDKACAALNRLNAPVVIFDRDWPGTEWRSVVEQLASSPQRASVILLSGVTDEYLFQELIRRGGYDVLTKPVRPQDAGRVIRSALSYWKVACSPAVQEPDVWR